MTTPTQITSPSQIICEGLADENFLCELIKRKDIKGAQVRCARNNNSDKCLGLSGFPDALKGLLGAAELSVAPISRILIVRDSDNDPGKAFTEAVGCLKKASLPVPDAPLISSKKAKGSIETCIMTIPWHRPGALETLLCEAANVSLPEHLVKAVDAFCKATEPTTKSWSIVKKHKMRLRCLIAGHWESDPEISLAFLLGKENQTVIDFDSPAFRDIAEFLVNFCCDKREASG